MKANKLGLTAASIGMLVLILDSRTAAQAAAEGMDLCIRTVIPSLFPFFLLSGYLTGNLRGGKWTARLFRCPESCGTILLTGLLGGYPIGARLAAQEYRSGRISKAQGDRLLMFCSQAGPSFLFGIAAGQLGDIRHAWLLWTIQIFSALTVAWLIPGQNGYAPASDQSRKLSLTDSMRGSLSAMASICGWVVIFSVVMDFLKRWVLWLLPETAQILLCGTLELTNGCLTLSYLDAPQLRFLLAAVMLNFGGLCVFMQTASVATGLSLSHYFLGKVLQTSLAVLYALAMIGHLYALLPVFCAFSLRKLMTARKNSSIPSKIGV